MVNRAYLLSGGILLFFLFIFFSFLVHKNFFSQLDFNTTVRLQDHVSRRFDDGFSLLSDIGKFEVMSIVLLIVLIAARKIWAGVIGLGLFVGFHLIELYGKFFVDHLPPPEFLLRTKHIVDFPQFHVRSENSYPSGHSGRTLFISTLLIILIIQNNKIRPEIKIALCTAIALYDLTMLVSRVYLGEHWLSDVIGGTILGLSFGMLTSAFLVGKEKGIALKGMKFPKYKVEIKKVE